MQSVINQTSVPLSAGLYVVATPIGNLGDITLRALEVLKQADVICAEDTRLSKRLLQAYGITTYVVSVYAHNEAEMAKKMQNAKTPADQQAFFKEVVAQLDLQKATLNKLKFNDPRVAQTRDKMVESITHSRAGTAALIKKPTATPETNPEIAKSMEKAQKSAEEARAMLMQLTEEAGIKPKGADAAPSKK